MLSEAPVSCCRQARQELKALKQTEAMFDEHYSDIPNGNGETEGLL